MSSARAQSPSICATSASILSRHRAFAAAWQAAAATTVADTDADIADNALMRAQVARDADDFAVIFVPSAGRVGRRAFFAAAAPASVLRLLAASLRSFTCASAAPLAPRLADVAADVAAASCPRKQAYFVVPAVGAHQQRSVVCAVCYLGAATADITRLPFVA